MIFTASHNAAQRLDKDGRQEIGRILSGEISGVEMDRFLNELALALALSRGYISMTSCLRLRLDPQGEFYFLSWHNTPLLLSFPMIPAGNP